MAMTRYFFLYATFLFLNTAVGQEVTGSQLLENSIEYHDPNGSWDSFKGILSITMQTPKGSDRISDIALNLPEEYFKLTSNKDENVIEYTLDKDECILALNGSTVISKAETDSLRLTCDRANMMKDYYTYLYGLPMKLKDPGTVIDPKVRTKTFKGKEYLVLKVSYEKTVGKDTWYFYFDPKNFAMEVYQFYHDQSKNDGEYILLNGEEKIMGIKMPKTRAWYFNKNDTYLGTDILTRTAPF